MTPSDKEAIGILVQVLVVWAIFVAVLAAIVQAA